MLECPRDPIPFLDKGMGELLGHEAADARPPQMAHNNERLPGRALDIQLRNLPCGAIVLRSIHRRAGIAHVHRKRPVPETDKAPTILMPPLIRCPHWTHALRREVGELLEQ